MANDFMRLEDWVDKLWKTNRFHAHPCERPHESWLNSRNGEVRFNPSGQLCGVLAAISKHYQFAILGIRHRTHETICQHLVDFLDTCSMRANRCKASMSPVGITACTLARESIVGTR